MNQDEKKQKAAESAFSLVLPTLNKESVLGIGTGSTTNFFIEELNKAKVDIKGAICSSEASKDHLQKEIKDKDGNHRPYYKKVNESTFESAKTNSHICYNQDLTMK